MRNLRYQAAIGLISLTLSNFSHAASTELIYGFNKIAVTEALTTAVAFDQADFKRYQKTDNLKLRVMDGNKVIREDAILNKEGVWVWNKILPFSENLKFLILKDDKPISTEYLADTKSSLVFSANSSSPAMIRGVHYLPAVAVTNNNEKKRLLIDTKELKNCKDKVLVVVFDKETNTLLWQHYDELKNQLTTDEIEFSKKIQPTIAIVTDEGSCSK